MFANTAAPVAVGPTCARKQEVKGRLACPRPPHLSLSRRATPHFFSFSRHSARVRAVSAFPRNRFPHLVRKELRGILSRDEHLARFGKNPLVHGGSAVLRFYRIRRARSRQNTLIARIFAERNVPRKTMFANGITRAVASNVQGGGESNFLAGVAGDSLLKCLNKLR